MKHLFFCWILVICNSVVAQKHFLANFQGEYNGYLKLENVNSLDSIPFQIEIKASENDSIFYTITRYFVNDTNTLSKDYMLQLDSLGNYVLDEKNGILIREKLVGNTFYTAYNVEETVYTVRTSYFKKYIDFELCVYSEKNQLTSLSDPDEHGDIYKVKDYPFLTVQHGVLYKAKKKKRKKKK